MALPRCRISSLSNVAPAMMPDGKAVTLSACRTPACPSLRHSCRKPTRGAEPVLPLQRPIKMPVPPVMFAFSASVIESTRARALP